MTEYWSVDRIADGIAVLERDDRSAIEIPLDSLPGGVREGDCLRDDGGGFIIDAVETERRRALNYDLFRSLLDK